ncbi:short-subunit dehydrogenase [Aeromicrobium sp. SORGH_AS981]|uniref:SDR family NAD(P)-dependent oxidoreductase n=1 Tax=Aeromicrobium sp. SORGH_AS_0981 TaxID=3041802 RepID=UPI00285BDB80|nr:SDR family NAD(P)-dependent oxidoreductase [Aeromicrobium sp. SORGH_AS_0981]MDR6120052.1 short-subunit dehydrogenase [Aeromicrobium sp. SORGH_AS_0981]
MTTIAIVGAGRGLGAAVARRFGKEGFAVALLARNQERVDALAADLQAEGIDARGWTTDVRDPDSLARTLEQANETQGPIEVLQYSPLPQKSFLRPLLETTVDDTKGAIEFSVYGPIAAVHAVLQNMRFVGQGTVLFVNGGTAVRPAPKFAGTSLSFAAQSAYAQMLHHTLADEDIHVAQLVIPGSIEEGHPQKDPTVLAETLWSMHTGRDEFRVFATDMDDEVSETSD